MEHLTQRRISAHAAPRVHTSAPSSIFDAGRQAKAAATPPRNVVDVDALVIRRGVPIPEAKHGTQGSKYQELLSRMQPGDSVVLPTKKAQALGAAAKKLKVKVALRALGGGQSGVWKL